MNPRAPGKAVGLIKNITF